MHPVVKSWGFGREPGRPKTTEPGMPFLEYLEKEGYTRFTGAVDESVYVFFDCPNPHKAVWYHHPGYSSYQCAGCREQCETDDPKGFQLTLWDCT